MAGPEARNEVSLCRKQGDSLGGDPQNSTLSIQVKTSGCLDFTEILPPGVVPPPRTPPLPAMDAGGACGK